MGLADVVLGPRWWSEAAIWRRQAALSRELGRGACPVSQQARPFLGRRCQERGGRLVRAVGQLAGIQEDGGGPPFWAASSPSFEYELARPIFCDPSPRGSRRPRTYRQRDAVGMRRRSSVSPPRRSVDIGRSATEPSPVQPWAGARCTVETVTSLASPCLRPPLAPRRLQCVPEWRHSCPPQGLRCQHPAPVLEGMLASIFEFAGALRAVAFVKLERRMARFGLTAESCVHIVGGRPKPIP